MTRSSFLRSQSGDSWGQRLVIESWADEYDFTWWAELIVAAGDRWREDGYDEPAFGAGLSFDHYRGHEAALVIGAQRVPCELSDVFTT